MAFRIIRNDITKVTADVIVNSANPRPICGGSTEAAIYDAAGYDELLDARQKIGFLEVGQLGVTPAFGLNAKNIIHISCPRWNEGSHESIETLRHCYKAILDQAVALGAKSVAIPLLSSGVYCFPKDVALQIAYEVCENFHPEAAAEVELDIVLIIYDPESFRIAEHFVDEFEDRLIEKSSYLHVSQITSSLPDEDFSLSQENQSNEILFARLPFANLSKNKASSVHQKLRKNEKSVIDDTSGVDKNLFLECGICKSSKKKKDGQDKVVEDIADAIKAMDDDTFQDKLNFFVERSQLEPKDIYRRANLNRKLFSKLKKDGYRPSKNTVLALSVGLQLNLDETSDFLSRAGYAFSPVSKADTIIKYCITQKDFYKKSVFLPIHRLNDYLETYGEESLGEAI